MSSSFPTDTRAILAALVSRPSVSPEGDTGGTRPGEAAMAAYVAAFLKHLGAQVTRHDVQPGRPNVVAVFEPEQPATATIALVPHLDTVGVAGMSVPPFTLTRRADRLHGRGSCDTKGPCAALLAALARWSRSKQRRLGSIRWIVAATMGEETGGVGAQALVTAGFKADFAIALEPTALKVVHANKGVLRVWLEADGRAAHGASPERGENAILALLPLLAAVDDKLRPQLSARRHPLLGPATVNLGVVSGGREFNIVPAHCRAGLDLRTHPGCDNATVLAWLETLRRRVAPSARVSLFREGPSYVTPRTNPWAKRLRRCGRGWATASWFCDANRFAAADIPAVAFGPGSIVQAHTHDEYITTTELAAGTAAFGRLLAER